MLEKLHQKGFENGHDIILGYQIYFVAWKCLKHGMCESVWNVIEMPDISISDWERWHKPMRYLSFTVVATWSQLRSSKGPKWHQWNKS